MLKLKVTIVKGVVCSLLSIKQLEGKYCMYGMGNSPKMTQGPLFYLNIQDRHYFKIRL